MGFKCPKALARARMLGLSVTGQNARSVSDGPERSPAMNTGPKSEIFLRQVSPQLERLNNF